MITFSRALAEFMPDGFSTVLAVLWKVAAILGGLLATFVTIMTVLSKFDKLPVHLVMRETTMVLTRRGDLQIMPARLYTRKYRRMYPKGPARDALNEDAPLRAHTKGLVWFIPWYRTPEVFDHKLNTQSLDAVTVEKPDKNGRWYQWKFPLAIASRIGKSHTDIRRAWLAAQDRDENLRMMIGGATDDALKVIAQEEFTKPGLAALVTTETLSQRRDIHLWTGIGVEKIMFPAGSFRTDVDAIRGLSPESRTAIAVASSQNGSNGHRPADV